MALKSYSEWKEGGGNGVWKFGGTSKPHFVNKCFLRKNCDLFVNSLVRSSSNVEKSFDSFGDETVRKLTASSNGCFFYVEEVISCLELQGMSEALQTYVRELLSDKKQEDIPLVSSFASIDIARGCCVCLRK